MQGNKISRLAAVLHGVTVAGLIVTPILVIGILVALPIGLSILPVPDDVPSTGVFLWAGVAVNCVPVVAFLWALDKLRQLFLCYRDGQVLTHRSSALILDAGRGLLWAAALNVLVQPVSSALLSWQAPIGEREVSVGIGTAEIGFVFVAGLLTLIGWAMAEAARQADENKAFV